MAALCKNVLGLSNGLRLHSKLAPFTACKRFLRLDPEEELDNLYINESFAEKMAQRQKTMPEPQVIGTQIAEIKAQLQQTIGSTTRATRARSRSAIHDVFEGTSVIPLSEVQNVFLRETDPQQALNVLSHYNIYKDLFQEHNVVFYPNPEVNLKVTFSLNEDEVIPVYRGNFINPSVTNSPPSIDFNGAVDKMYSLLMLNMDGNLSSHESAGYLHWYCSNMTSDGGVTSGSSCEYLQAIPLRGTGYHRYVFLLLQHDKALNTSLFPVVDAADLKSRTFTFSDLYKQLSDDVIPVGVQFFQCEWDESVRQTFHQTLDMAEPAYEYMYPPTIRKRQVKYGHKEQFNLFLDRYRDKKEIAEDVLKEHLANTSPYKPLEDQRPLYPLATPTKPGLYADDLPPTWIQKTLKHKANKTGKYKYIYSEG